jgi:6-pyruvoyltetrahydropterin/6-carboxytetrahydropterin synthase
MDLGFITRRFKFSASHRFWIDNLNEEENKKLFGNRASKYGFGHNYVLDVTVKGQIDKTTGMVINLTELKRIGDKVVKQFDHKFLNEELPFFKKMQPTAENLARLFWELIEKELPSGIFLHKIRLYPSDEVFAEYCKYEEQYLICKTYGFSATHRLYTPQLNEDENKNVYDKCFSKLGHGHNYKLTVYFKGVPDIKTGMVVSLKKLDEKVKSFINEFLHAKRLDLELDKLKNKPSTSENLINYIFEELKSSLGESLYKLKLKETDNNFFEKGDCDGK